MKIKGLDGKDYSLTATSHTNPIRPEASAKSKFQYNCGQILKEFLPNYVILEEVYLPGSSGLYLDFLIPKMRIALECHGEQHDKMVPFFHGDKRGFERAIARDAKKQEWCDLNGISLYIVRSEQELRELF